MGYSNLLFATGPLELRPPSIGVPVLTVRAPRAAASAASLELEAHSLDYPGFSTVNDVFITTFNRDGSDAAQPVWSDNFEARYVKDAPPAGWTERHWNYQSLDRAVSYRPWHTLMDLADNRLIEWSVAQSWRVHGLHDGTMSATPAFELATGNSDAEGEARFARPTVSCLDGSQLVIWTGSVEHRLVLAEDASFTHGVFDLRPARYDANGTPTGWSFVNLHARAASVRADSGQPAALSFRGNGTGGDSVGFRLAAGSRVLEFVYSGASMDPASWLFSPDVGQAFVTPSLAVNTSSASATGGGAGVVALAEAATVPTSNPPDGGVLYIQSGALKYRGSAGTVTTLA